MWNKFVEVLTYPEQVYECHLYSHCIFTVKSKSPGCIPASLCNLREEDEPKFAFLSIVYKIDNTERGEKLINTNIKEMFTFNATRCCLQLNDASEVAQHYILSSALLMIGLLISSELSVEQSA